MSQDFPGAKGLEPAPSPEALGFFCLHGQESTSLVQGLFIRAYDANTIEKNSNKSHGNEVQAHASGVGSQT